MAVVIKLRMLGRQIYSPKLNYQQGSEGVESRELQDPRSSPSLRGCVYRGFYPSPSGDQDRSNLEAQDLNACFWRHGNPSLAALDRIMPATNPANRHSHTYHESSIFISRDFITRQAKSNRIGLRLFMSIKCWKYTFVEFNPHRWYAEQFCLLFNFELSYTGR